MSEQTSNSTMNKNILIFALAFFATSLVSAQPSSLEPFQSWQIKNPNWPGDVSEVAYVATRCSSLFGVVGSVFSNSGKTADDKAKAVDIISRSILLSMFGSKMAETVGWSIEKSTQRFLKNGDLYQQVISSNRITHNNMFYGFVQSDYQFCLDFEQTIKAAANQANK